MSDSVRQSDSPPAAAASDAGLFESPRSARLGKILFIFLLAWFLGLATWANLDLRSERCFLFVDELIVFDNTRRILDAPDAHTLGFRIADGDDHRYGRVLYNVCALTGFVPYKLFGVPGLVVAIRTTVALMLLGAYVIFCCAFLRSWVWRALLLLILGALPFTNYYATAPKPEPLQILFFAIFFALTRKRGLRFGWHWLFLGLAFGAKISALPVVAVCGALTFAAAVLQPDFRARLARETKGLVLAVISFLAGWVLAVPIIASFSATQYRLYWGWTFGATTHGHDNASVTPMTWVRSFFDTTLLQEPISPAFVLVATIAVAAIALRELLAFWRRRAQWREWPRDEFLQFWLYAGASALPIILLVKRTWGIYLQAGLVFAAVATLIAVERLARDWSWRSRGWRSAGIALAFGASAAIAAFTLPPVIEQYGQTASRSQGEYVQRQSSVFHALGRVLGELQDRPAVAARPLEVIFDAYLFTPESTGRMHLVTSWGAFKRWEDSFDVVVLSERDQMKFLRSEPLSAALPETRSNYADFVAAQAEYRRRIVAPEGPPSFKLYRVVQGEAFVFVHRRLEEAR